MRYPFEGAFLEAARRLDQLRFTLNALDPPSPTADPQKREMNAAQRAGTYVWLAATLEGYLRDGLTGLLNFLNSQTLNAVSLKPGLLALLWGGDFERLQTVRGLKNWSTRVRLLNACQEAWPVEFALERLPLDGRTIQPAHLETIWDVFDLPGEPLPSPRHQLALIDLSDWRNRLAHGEVSPEVVGHRKAVDLPRRVEDVEDVIEHLHLTLEIYCSDQHYLR